MFASIQDNIEPLAETYHGEDKNDGGIALEALGRIPLKLGPGFRRKLLHRPFHLSFECGNLGQPLP